MRPQRNLRRLTGILAVAAVMSVPMLTAASADSSTPAWEPDPNAVGTLSFFNSSGDAVTGGNNLNHLFDYAEASTPDPSTHPGNQANLEFANPSPGENPGLWTTSADESSEFPDASAPGTLGTAPTGPVVALDADGADLAAAASGFVPNTQAGYENVYQIRLYTTGPNGSGTGGGKYWDADVMVNGSNWTELYPAVGGAQISTTTTVSVSPTSPATQGAAVTITATEIATDSTHPAGSMEIDDGNQMLGTAAVDSNGSYSVTTTTLLPGSHSFTATFTPTSSSYNGSTTASATSYVVDPVATTPTITSTQGTKVGDTVKCSEPVTSGETVTYAWKAGSKTVGTGSSLKIPGVAYNQTLTCTATVKIPAGATSSATSSGIKVGLGAALKAKTAPKLSGSGKVGSTEKVSKGSWTPAASSYSYQWYLGSSKIKGATKSSLKLTSKDKGKKLACQVTAKATGYANGTAKTKPITVKS